MFLPSLSVVSTSFHVKTKKVDPVLMYKGYLTSTAFRVVSRQYQSLYKKTANCPIGAMLDDPSAVE